MSDITDISWTSKFSDELTHSSDSIIANSDRHHRRREKETDAVKGFGNTFGWHEQLPLLRSDDIHHHWLMKFHRHFLSTRHENFDIISEEDADHLLRHDPLVPNVLGLHVEASVLESTDDTTEILSHPKCRTLHVTRPDGLQLIFDVFAKPLHASIRTLLADPNYTFVIHNIKEIDACLKLHLTEPIARIFDIQPVIDFIKESEADVFGKLLPSNADLEDVVRIIVGGDNIGHGFGVFLTSSLVRGVMALDICGLIERKYMELVYVRDELLEQKGKFVQLPKNLLWSVEKVPKNPFKTLVQAPIKLVKFFITY